MALISAFRILPRCRKNTYLSFANIKYFAGVELVEQGSLFPEKLNSKIIRPMD